VKTPGLSVEEGVRMNGTLEMAPVVQRVAPREVKLHSVGPSSRLPVKQAEE